MMRVCVLGTHLPIALGDPQQRLSDALRGWFAARAETRSITVDLHGTEAAARLRRSAGDLLIPAGFPRESAGRRKEGLSHRQSRRIGDLVSRINPDLIVVADPLLASMAPELNASGAALRLIDDGSAAWHGLMARRLPSAEGSRAHMLQAAILEEAAATFSALMNVPSDPGPGLAFADDERFFDKFSSIVSLTTGNREMDRLTIRTLVQMLKELSTSDVPPPGVTLVGFDNELSRLVEGAVSHGSWMHLEALVGSARALVLPMLAPPLAAIAEAALCLGTPVVTGAADAKLAGLSGIRGVYCAAERGAAEAAGRLLDPDITGPDDWRDIAATAGVRRQARMARTLTDLEGLQKPTTSGNDAPFRKRRIPPLIGPVEVLWNPLSRMLLVRLKFRRDAAVEEVRLLDAQGNELIRLMPNAAERERLEVRVEGGVVTTLEELGGGLTVELRDARDCLQSINVATDEFVWLDAEIAWITPDGLMVHGAFWLSGSAPPAGNIALTTTSDEVNLLLGEPVDMPEIDGKAVPFTVPLPLLPDVPVHLGQLRTGPYREVVPLVQRPLLPNVRNLGKPSDPPPEIEALRDVHSGRRAWIIGNGPSVRQEDLAAIPEDDIKFCFNRFYLSYDTHPLRENYVVSADTLMIADFGHEMIVKSTGLPLFCAPPAVLPQHLNGGFVLLPAFQGTLPLFSMDPANFVSIGGSSVFVALQMAHYMGLRDIVLYGLDYSFSMKMQQDPRFTFPVSFDDGNHFIASYRSAKPWCPPTWRDISAGFLNARVAFETTGGRVRNATRGGKLETFERVDFDAVVAESAAIPAADAAVEEQSPRRKTRKRAS